MAHRMMTAKLRTRNSKQKVTKRALGIPLASFLVDILGMRKRFSILTVKRGKNAEFTIVDMCIGILAVIMLECDRLYHINLEYRQEQVIATQLGLKRFFSQCTAHRFLNRFFGWHVNQLKKIHLDMLAEHGQVGSAKRITLDIDATTHSFSARKREGGTPGYNKKKKGNDCYQQSVAFCQKEVIYLLLDKGYVHCKTRFSSLFAKAKEILSQINIVRLDGGYFAWDVIDQLENEKTSLFYAIAAPANCLGTIAARQLAAKHPEKFKPISGKKEIYLMDFPSLQPVSKLKIKRRYLLVKSRRQPKKVKDGYVYFERNWYYYGLVTNIPKKEMHSKKLYRFYHQRVTIEQYFKESRQSFASGKLPSQKFRANEAYLWFVAIAYNNSIWFKRDVLTKEHKTKSFATIRRQLSVVCVIELQGNFLILVFPQNPTAERIYRYLCYRLNQLKTRASP
jgi:hypothetical protein